MKKIVLFFLLLYLINKVFIPIDFEAIKNDGEKIFQVSVNIFKILDGFVDELMTDSDEISSSDRNQRDYEANRTDWVEEDDRLNLDAEEHNYKETYLLSDTVKETFYYYLQDEEKRCYRAILKGAKEGESIIDTLERDSDEYDEKFDQDLELLSKLTMFVGYDHPELLILSDYKGFNYYFSRDMYAMALQEGTTQEEHMEKINVIDMKTRNDIQNIVSAGMDDYDKLVAIYEHVLSNVEYKDSDSDYCRSLYGAAIENQSVCVGYAMYFKRLCDLIDIDSTIILSADHAWNLVKLYGQVYHVDATWDDTDENGEWDYFLLSNEELSAIDSTDSHEFDLNLYYLFE